MTTATHIDPQDRDTGFMLAVAVRYCLDRHSYAPSLCCDWLRKHWHLLSESSRRLIVQDIRRHIETERQTAEIRARSGGGPAGWECDLRTWESMAEWIGSSLPVEAAAQEGQTQ